MEMQQILEILKAMQEKADANRKAVQANAKASREQMMADRIADGEFMRQMMAKMESWGEKIWAEMEAIQTKTKAMRDRMETNMKACQETTTCHEATEAETERNEPHPRMMQSIEVHQEIPKEDAAVMPVGGRSKRRRVCNLAVERRQKRKERTRGNSGSMRIRYI
jgi:hypothetical protein